MSSREQQLQRSNLAANGGDGESASTAQNDGNCCLVMSVLSAMSKPQK